MSRRKLINIADGACFIRDLKKALERCKESSHFSLKLCIDEPEKEDIEVAMLKDLCSELYEALRSAKQCVDACAEDERKLKHKVIYYEGGMGCNAGATQLKADIEKTLENYCKERVQIDLGYGLNLRDTW